MTTASFLWKRLSRSLLAPLMGLACLATQPGAHAQNVAPFGFTLVMNEVQIYINLGGAGGWTGITEEGVDDGGRLKDLVKGVETRGNRSFVPRAMVQYVCSERCSSNFFGDEPKEDTVFWKDGSQTTGRIEVRCGEYNRCFVYQDGKPRHPKASYEGDWPRVKYMYLAKSAKP
ncbi:MAG: hypothetical protein JO163_14805 [Methylobacteriaceae bacterium]|nr:hypothetical protein [Methylobacteriaceae bacterium]MBV9703998.1 hypothetical protein [Methylobacteriaceae bacterium]